MHRSTSAQEQSTRTRAPGHRRTGAPPAGHVEKHRSTEAQEHRDTGAHEQITHRKTVLGLNLGFYPEQPDLRFNLGLNPRTYNSRFYSGFNHN